MSRWHQSNSKEAPLLYHALFFVRLWNYLGGENPDSTRGGVGEAGLGSILLHGEHDLFELLFGDPHPPIGMKRAVAF